MLIKKTDIYSIPLSSYLTLIFWLFITLSVNGQKTGGQTLFEAHCLTCHGLHNAATGPALNDITSKRPLPWLIDFIKSSQSLIARGDTAAYNIYKQYYQIIMPDQPLVDSQIIQILQYIQENSKSADLTVDSYQLTDDINENFMLHKNSANTKLIVICGSLITLIIAWFLVKKLNKNY